MGVRQTTAAVRHLLPLLLAVSAVGPGCKKKLPEPIPVALAEDALLVAMRARPLPDPAQAKLSVKLTSKQLGIAAPPLNGGLIVDRPGKAYFTILSPFGGSVFTVATDGTSATMINTQDRQIVRAADAAHLLSGASADAVQLDDLVGILQGLVPLAPGSVTSREDVEGGVLFKAKGPANTTIAAVVEKAGATPVRVDVSNAEGALLVTAVYEPFVPSEGGFLVPSRVTLVVLPVDLTVDVKYKTWTVLTTVPDVFTPASPEGYTEMTFEEYGAEMKKRMEARQQP